MGKIFFSLLESKENQYKLNICWRLTNLKHIDHIDNDYQIKTEIWRTNTIVLSNSDNYKIQKEFNKKR